MERSVLVKNMLVVVDMQNDFIEGKLGTEEARQVVPRIVEKIKNVKYGKIVFTQDTHFANYLSTLEGKYLPVEHCLYKTSGWMLNKDIQEEISSSYADISFFKKTAFGSRELAKKFDDDLFDGVSCIEIVGVCTDICVISNAILLKTFAPDIPIIVDSSCCAGTTTVNHEAALQVMRSCQIEVT